MEDYWNKMQQKFIDQNQYPQSLPQGPTPRMTPQNQPPPLQSSTQQIPKATPNFAPQFNPISESNPYYPYQLSDFQSPPQPRKIESFDGIIEPRANQSQGHYGFNNEDNADGCFDSPNGCFKEVKALIHQNMSQTAKCICLVNCVIWLIIIIMIFKNF